MFTVLKIEALVIYHFPILVLRRIFDRGGNPLLLIFLLVSMILVLTVREIFVVSLEKNGAPSPLTRESPLYNIFQKVYIYIYVYMYIYIYNIYIYIYIYIYKHTEWVRQPSKKYFVCISCELFFLG